MATGREHARLWSAITQAARQGSSDGQTPPFTPLVGPHITAGQRAQRKAGQHVDAASTQRAYPKYIRHQ